MMPDDALSRVTASAMLYCCRTLLLSCLTVLLPWGENREAITALLATLLLRYYFTTAFLLLYYCLPAAARL
jgi:hypothetical protein